MKVRRREGWQCSECSGINYHLESCDEKGTGEPTRKEHGISKFQAIINSCREARERDREKV